jgi:ABC-type transport system involved in Fe-S cluster assembly fused permease/ATPase subunit
MNEFDSAAHTRAIDSLLNYETVKYFNNEDFEARRYDESLDRLRRARLKSQTTLSLLNTGQQLIIGVGLVAMLWRATQGVADGRMTLGDLVMINAFMIQLYIPLNFLGVLYREIKQSLTDLDKMFGLMDRAPRGARRARMRCRWRSGVRRCASRTCGFAYEAKRPILHGVELRDPGRQDGGGGRAVGLGQVDAGAPAVPLLRRAHRGGASRSTARTSAA